MPRYKDDFSLGLEHILNTPQASFMKSPAVFNEIHNKAAMPITAILRHVGKRKRNGTPKVTDEQKSEERLSKLEEASKK